MAKNLKGPIAQDLKILKELSENGMLSERIYAASGDDKDEDDDDGEEPDGTPITRYGDARIDGGLGQSIPGHIADRNGIEAGSLDPTPKDGQKEGALPDPSNPSGSDAETADTAKEQDSGDDSDDASDEGDKESQDGEAKEDGDGEAQDAPAQGMDPALFVTGLCHQLKAAQHFAQGMLDHKAQFIAKYGDDKLPILNEIIHKVSTAFDMLSQFEAGSQDQEGGEGDGEEDAKDEDPKANSDEGDGKPDDEEGEDTEDSGDEDADSDKKSKKDEGDGEDDEEKTESSEADCHTFDSDTQKCLDEPDDFVGLESKQPKKRPGFLNISFGRRSAK